MRWFPTVVLTCFLVAGPSTDVRAQTIPAVGSSSTFDLATWNIEWFGSSSNGPGNEDLQLESVARIIADAEIDLWALQEIDDEAHFWSLVEMLGAGWEGTISSGSNFQLGYIFNTDVIALRGTEEILDQFEDDFAGRPPLLIDADVMLPDDTVRATIITLHMKAFGDASSYGRRDRAATHLKNRLDFFYANEPMIVLGDFNDELTSSIRSGEPSPYAAFVADEENYAFLTLPLDEQDVPTWCDTPTCSIGSTFDHILITDELFAAAKGESTDRFDELIDAVDQYTSTTSDHLPVYARFRFSTHTSTEGQLRQTLSTVSLFPHPVRNMAYIAYDASMIELVTVRVYDLLGRQIGTPVDRLVSRGDRAITLDTGDLSPGSYFVRLRAGDRTFVKTMIVAR